MPTVRDTRSRPPSRSTPALVVIGQNPGLLEDENDTPFIGPSGSHARTTYTEAPGFLELASVYFSNVYRCRTPRSDDNPKASWAKPCSRTHLAYDLARLSKVHPSLTLLLLGGAPCSYVHDLFGLGKPSLKKAFTSQGETHTATFYDTSVTATFFVTYHPAYLLRQNKHVVSVSDHLRLLYDFLVGAQPTPVEVTRISPRPPSTGDHP